IDVELIARGPGAPYVERFECEQELAVTADLPAGRYTIELRAEADDGAVLGSGVTAGAIGADLCDLGTVEIAIGGGSCARRGTRAAPGRTASAASARARPRPWPGAPWRACPSSPAAPGCRRPW